MKKNPKMTAALREREAHSREIGKRIQSSCGRARWEAWEEKRAFGRDTRSLLLAHAMMRKIPYIACEPRRKEDNPPSISGITMILQLTSGETCTPDAIKAWLKGVETKTASVAA